MQITHVIRGDDHFTNAFRQTQIYRALAGTRRSSRISRSSRTGWCEIVEAPRRARVDAYREMGYLPEALRNYLLRLGWSHATRRSSRPTRRSPGSISTRSGGRRRGSISPSSPGQRALHPRADDARLAGLIAPLIAAKLGHELGELERERLVKAMPG